MKRFLYYILPVLLGLFARRNYFLPVDTFNLLGKIPDGVAPRGKIFIDYGHYIKQSEKSPAYFQKLCGLQPNHAILYIGCAIGRMAVPLTRFLSGKGSYDGFDIVKSGIDWCNKNISDKHPNFRFQYTGFYNQFYNTSDKVDACNFVFPYEDAKFDFVFLTFVFTHMMPAEVEHYINEISEKPGKTSLKTENIQYGQWWVWALALFRLPALVDLP